MTDNGRVHVSLWDAHHLMAQRRPARGADLAEFLRFHQDNLAMYQSLVDRRASHWEERERHYIRQVEKRMKEAEQQDS